MNSLIHLILITYLLIYLDFVTQLCHVTVTIIFFPFYLLFFIYSTSEDHQHILNRIAERQYLFPNLQWKALNF